MHSLFWGESGVQAVHLPSCSGQGVVPNPDDFHGFPVGGLLMVFKKGLATHESCLINLGSGFLLTYRDSVVVLYLTCRSDITGTHLMLLAWLALQPAPVHFYRRLLGQH